MGLQWEHGSDIPGVGVLARGPSGASRPAGSQLHTSGCASYPWAGSGPNLYLRVVRDCGKIWAFARSLLVDGEAGALGLMEAERAGREEQSLLGRRKHRERPHCSPSLGVYAPELRWLARRAFARRG